VDEAFDGLIRIRGICAGMSADSISVAGWALPFMRFSISVIARTLKARLAENRAWRRSANSALPARAALGAPFCETGRAVVGGAVGIDGSERSAEFYIKAWYAGKDRLDGGASVSVFRPGDASAGMGRFWLRMGCAS